MIIPTPELVDSFHGNMLIILNLEDIPTFCLLKCYINSDGIQTECYVFTMNLFWSNQTTLHQSQVWFYNFAHITPNQ